MKPATLTPVYVAIFQCMSEAARSCGYALAVHGSLTRDLDVVAIPWTAEATSSEEVVRAMAESVAHRAGEDLVIGGPNRSAPHGREGWSIPLLLNRVCGDDPGYVDVSVMPRRPTEEPAPAPRGSTAWRCGCGAWNHSPCRKCGAGPDERYASKAELDALASPRPEDRRR